MGLLELFERAREAARAAYHDRGRRPLFLKWALVNVLAAAGLAVLAAHDFFSDLSGAPKLGAVTILAFTSGMTLYAGWLAWRADDVQMMDGKARVADERKRQSILHDLGHVFHAVWVCQILGIIGALVGYREQTQAAADATGEAGAAVREVFTALGNGLIATTLGVLCSLLFFVEYRMIEHALGRDRD
jgi:hypothetical protein